MTAALKSSRLARGWGPCAMKPGILSVVFWCSSATPSPCALTPSDSSCIQPPMLGEAGS